MPLSRHVLRALYSLLPAVFSIPLHAATPPALSNPDATPENLLGPEYYGALGGGAAVSAGGNASYSIPIDIPPGINGVAPQLSLSYNSNVKNGLLGLG